MKLTVHTEIKKPKMRMTNIYRLNEVLHRLIKKSIKATKIYSESIEHLHLEFLKLEISTFLFFFSIFLFFF